MNRPVILAVGGPLQGQHFSVDSQGVRIGRDPANEVVIPTPDVSRHHARVILHNGALWVQDAGSRNGVYVNGNRVSGHTQVAPGDRVSVGNSEFQVQLAGEDTDGSVSVNMDAVRPQGKPAKNKKKSQRTRADRQSGEGTRKRWPLVVAAVALVGLLGLVFLVGLRGKDTEDPNLAEMRKAIEPAPFSLGTLKAEQESKKVEATAEAQPSSAASFKESLDAAAGNNGEEQAEWPKPPPGAIFGDVRFQADLDYEQGRLREALVGYQIALQLNGECEVCRGRIDTIGVQILEKVREAYLQGMRYQEAHQYQQAIYAFERTLLLDPDKTLENTLRAVEQIEETRKNLPHQY